MDFAKKHTCLICGHEAAVSQTAPLQCLHCGGLGFFSLFLAPHQAAEGSAPKKRAAGEDSPRRAVPTNRPGES